MCTFLLQNGALWDICLMHCGIVRSVCYTYVPTVCTQWSVLICVSLRQLPLCIIVSLHTSCQNYSKARLSQPTCFLLITQVYLFLTCLWIYGMTLKSLFCHGFRKRKNGGRKAVQWGAWPKIQDFRPDAISQEGSSSSCLPSNPRPKLLVSYKCRDILPVH